MKGRLLISGNFLAQPLTGVQRHAWEITSRLLDTDLQPLVVVPQGLRVAPEYGADIEGRLLRLGGSGGHLWQQFVLPRYLTSYDLLWTPTGLAALTVSRQVLTLHDVSVLEHPEWFSPLYSAFYGLWLPTAIRRALHVFTSSEFSRGRIVARTGVPENRITSISSAVCSTFRDPSGDTEEADVKSRYGLPDRFLLSVGSIEPRKNLRNLLAAGSQLFEEFPDLHIVLVGGQTGIYKKVDIESCPGDRITALGYVPDRDLRAIYRAASLFVYPSLYEGFGIPPLEAMSCGTPVVTSRATSLPEVVGAAAILVDPLDVTSIADGIRRVLRDSDLQARLRADGYVRSASFDWDSSARSVYNVLERFIAA